MSDHWTGNKRQDGIKVEPTMYDNYEITVPHAGTFTHCPCCGAFMLSERAAKQVVDKLWPINQTPTRQ